MASMWEPEINVARGLAGVVAATTKICLIDGQEGHLYYRGYDAIRLARESSYEEVAYLLLFGELPTTTQLKSFSQTLSENRTLSPGMLDLLRTLPGAPKPMDALRTAVASMAATDASPSDVSRSANLRRAASCPRTGSQPAESPVPADPQ